MQPGTPPLAHLSYQNGTLQVEGIALDTLAESFGTPLYVYSRAAIEAAFSAYQEAIVGHDALICYAVKANPSLAILDLLARLGAGFDIVSGGELGRVLAVGADPAKVVFSGVGKLDREIEAAIAAGIHCFNIESVAELEQINTVAGRLNRLAPVSLRVNPDVDARTHPYISTGLKDNKFGVAWNEARTAYQRAASLPNLRVVGIDCHIGSQLTDASPYGDALDRVLTLVDQLAADGIALEHADLGGGLGIRYHDETPPTPSDYLPPLLDKLAQRGLTGIVEPGRSIVGNAGLLLTRTTHLKPGETKNFAIVDAAMNDLMRPSLYEAWHEIVPVVERPQGNMRYDIVGPVCESGDFLGKDRDLALNPGDLLAVLSAGAYGMSMASNYNSRGRAAEVLVDGTDAHLIRMRESLEDQVRLEKRLP